MILSLVNVKGGVGKTTTAVNLAATFARNGLRLLVVDLDPQASASFSLGHTGVEGGATVEDLLLGGVAAAEVVRETEVPGVDLVPGGIELAGADLALARKRDPQALLSSALAPLRRRYDFIVIDCPPGLSILTVNGLVAAKAFVVPVVPHDLDMEALGRCMVGIERLAARFGRMPPLLGILLTMVDHRTRVTDEVVAEIRKAWGRRVFRTEVPINVRLAEAPGYGLTIFDYQSWSTGAQAYTRLGAEILRRARKEGLI